VEKGGSNRKKKAKPIQVYSRLLGYRQNRNVRAEGSAQRDSRMGKIKNFRKKKKKPCYEKKTRAASKKENKGW